MPSEHGTRSRYVQGCREDCPATPSCTDAHLAYSREYNRKRTERLKAEGMTVRCAVKGCPWIRRGEPDAVLALQRAHRAEHGTVVHRRATTKVGARVHLVAA
jgi:hypothetical protein